jgi:ABC-2 type transport system ATP-binding protein
VRDEAIVTQGLRRHFGPIKAVDGVDLAAPAGTVLGLLGPNGAGKTTIVRILTTLRPGWPATTSSATPRPCAR